MPQNVFAEPRDVSSLDDCFFYHTTDLPDGGVVTGEWDLRGREDAYLGGFDFSGKRVLEVGTASGFLCFEMEKRGAQVTGFDLSENQEWDIVPYAGFDYARHIEDRKAHIRKLNNSWWYMHGKLGSKAQVVYESVYGMPEGIGDYDVCTFGAILLHLRDPFLAMQHALSHVKETVIVTDMTVRSNPQQQFMAGLAGGRLARFIPNAEKCRPYETWWRMHPQLICEFLKVLGFTPVSIDYHHQLYREKETEMFTLIARRLDPEEAKRVAPLNFREPTDEEQLEIENVILRRFRFSHIVRHLVARALGRLAPSKSE